MHLNIDRLPRRAVLCNFSSSLVRCGWFTFDLEMVRHDFYTILSQKTDKQKKKKAYGKFDGQILDKQGERKNKNDLHSSRRVFTPHTCAHSASAHTIHSDGSA